MARVEPTIDLTDAERRDLTALIQAGTMTILPVSVVWA